MSEQINNDNASYKLVPSAQQLYSQIDSRWSSRDKEDLKINNKTETREFMINKNLNGSDEDAEWLFIQLLAYCKNKKPGSVRISIIQNENEIASGNHSLFFWQRRNWNDNIGNNIKIVFNTHGEKDSILYDIPILVNGESGVWSKEKPFYDTIVSATFTGAADRSVWNLACRLKELGFIEEAVLPEGRQKYPKNAIRNLQDLLGLQRSEYNESLHRLIWNDFSLSIETP